MQLYLTLPYSFLVSLVLCSALLATQSLRSPSCLCGLLPPSGLLFLTGMSSFTSLALKPLSEVQMRHSTRLLVISSALWHRQIRWGNICIHSLCGSMCTFAFYKSGEWEIDIAAWNLLMIIKHGNAKYGNLRVICLCLFEKKCELIWLEL